MGSCFRQLPKAPAARSHGRFPADSRFQPRSYCSLLLVMPSRPTPSNRWRESATDAMRSALHCSLPRGPFVSLLDLYVTSSASARIARPYTSTGVPPFLLGLGRETISTLTLVVRRSATSGGQSLQVGGVTSFSHFGGQSLGLGSVSDLQCHLSEGRSVHMPLIGGPIRWILRQLRGPSRSSSSTLFSL